MRSVLKALPLAALGCAAALLVACGDGNGLLSGAQAGNLQDALAAVQSACDEGDTGHAAIAAQSFADRVNALPQGAVDRRLVGDLQDGAAQLEALVARSCTGAATTTTTPTITTTTETTPTETTTTTTTPTETTTTPTTPPVTTPTTPTTPPDNGGGTPGEGGDDGNGNSGGVPGNPGGAAPGQVKKALKELEKEAKR
jgi:hypothetical protein